MMAALNNPVDLVIEAIGGRDSDLADRIGVTRAAVSRWRKKRQVPVRRLAAVCAISNIPPHVLCPYVPDPQAKSRR